MPAVTQLAAIREMTPEELQEYSDRLYEKCNGDSLKLTEEEQKELLACSVNFFQLTGEAIKMLQQVH